jgi:CDP-glucose 4,6-dehydratase
MVNASFWAGRRVLLTGHTGFKGAWLAFWLHEMGARVSGIALAPESSPNLHDLLGIADKGDFVQADINDRAALDALIARAKPEVVIHMAAQALVRPSYAAPVETFAANVLGTVNLMDALRHAPDLRSVVVVTSDKVYENAEWEWGYRENDPLGGYDPYSASKGCTEIAVSSMRRSFFGANKHPARIATARAGNVIGGGDWSVDRLVPDLVRGCLGEEGVVHLRNPNAVRPWQHVLEPLRAYLILAERLFASEGYEEGWNIGPEDASGHPVIAVAQALVDALGQGRIEVKPDNGTLHEAGLLTLDTAKARSRLGWRQQFDFDQTIAMTAQWYAAWARGEDVVALTRQHIARASGIQG